MGAEKEQDKAATSPTVDGLLACIEVGLAHLTPEQRRDWEPHAEPNLLLRDPAGLTFEKQPLPRPVRGHTRGPKSRAEATVDRLA